MFRRCAEIESKSTISRGIYRFLPSLSEAVNFWQTVFGFEEQIVINSFERIVSSEIKALEENFIAAVWINLTNPEILDSDFQFFRQTTSSIEIDLEI